MQLGLGLTIGAAAVYGGGKSWTTDVYGCLGDSITRQQQYTWGGSISRWVWTQFAWAPRAAMAAGRKFWVDPAACEGYSGYRTDQILASMLAADATTVFGPAGATVTIPYGVRAVRPQYCFELSGTNDLTQALGGSSAIAVTNRRAIWAALRAIGVEPVALSLLPRNDAYASAVPTWNEAFRSAAVADGVKWIDIYTTCADGTAWKSGYDWNDGAEDALKIHPGADGARAIGEAIAAAITGYTTKTPFLATATQAEYATATATKRADVASTAWDGLVGSAANWPKRYEPLYTSVRTAAVDDVAQVGKALIVQCAPQAAEFYSDSQSPIVAATVGSRYGAFCRLKYDAGAAKPSGSDVADSLGLYVYDNAYRPICGIVSGARHAYSAYGASIGEADFYTEFVSPVTQLRLWFEQRTQPASAGSTFKIAQMGIVAL